MPVEGLQVMQQRWIELHPSFVSTGSGAFRQCSFKTGALRFSREKRIDGGYK